MNSLIFDVGSRRRKDDNGFLHVAASHISKETVNPYYGREIPGWEELGLEPDRIYYGYRAGEELAKGADTFNGLPLLLGHYPESAEAPQKEHRVGSLSAEAAWSAPYLDNALVITDARAIEAVESGRRRQLSAAYQFTPVMSPGVFQGEAYDFIMTDIRGNHVALVEEGRAGPDVAVSDQQITPQTERTTDMGLIDKIKKLIAEAEGLDTDKKGLANDEEPELKVELKEEPKDDPAPPAVTDNPAEELAALIGSLEDKELAAKIMALVEALRPAPAADEDKDEPAEDEDKPADGEIKAMDQQLRRLALDVKAAEDRAVKKALARFGRLSEAARKVRPLVGEIDPLAFDRAGGIYAYALKSRGLTPRTSDESALADMVDMALKAASPAAQPAQAPLDMDGPFKGLANIKISH
ncbi:MAG: DUF2213 domain-containing protein [Candidatus Adiutrix sp.]|nr:DUF2213 domain-containing protein [Candidatus Adiutrix sp.]